MHVTMVLLLQYYTIRIKIMTMSIGESRLIISYLLFKQVVTVA